MWLLLGVVAAMTAVACGIKCEEVRMRCAYRSGCGTALTNYMLYCETMFTGPATDCPKMCEHSLIALTSTVEGKELINCECEDEYCEDAKKRTSVCRPQVMKGMANAAASCRLSQLICLADAQCAKALEYYNRLCRAMFDGRKCSKKCRNSIDILRKQEKAAALTNCQCDGYEDYDCPGMRSNLATLCFHKHKKNRNKVNITAPPFVEVQAAAAVSNALLPSALLVLTCMYNCIKVT